MEEAQQAVANTQASRARALKDELMQAAFHCIENAQYINEILKAGTIKPSSYRIMDENRVSAAIEQTANALSLNRVNLNVSTQNRLRAHIEHLQRELTETRNQLLQLQQMNISLTATLDAEVAGREKLLNAKLTSAQIEEQLHDLESFEVNMNQEMFPTPKKKDGGVKMPKGAIIGGGNLFGPKQELQHNKIKY
jgi:hypothetical protein